MLLTPEQIDKAVKWWAKDIQNPTFMQVKPGYDTEQTIKARALHGMNIDTLPDSKIEKFSNSLRQILLNQTVPLEIRVDYHPEGHLQEAAYAADISHSNFSIKTKMIFHDDGRVFVSHGHGADFRKI